MKNYMLDTAEEKPPRAGVNVQYRASGAQPLIGLSVKLPHQCKCGSNMAVVRVGLLARLQCAACQANRGWLSRETYEFISRIIIKFGPLTAPITMGRGEGTAAIRAMTPNANRPLQPAIERCNHAQA
jgi:hypothetical protein